MEREDWKPVYMTEDERADVAARLLMRAEDTTDPVEQKRCRYLASLHVFATDSSLRAAS